MYSKNKLLYKTGLKRAWVSWAKSENGRENAMGRHNLYNLAAHLCQEFWYVFLPLPPSLTSPSTSPPPSVELFFNKRPPSPCGWGDKPLLFTRKFWWHIDFGNLLRFMTSRGNITHDLMCDRQLNTVKSGILFRASAGKYLLIGLAANCKRKPAKHRWRQLRQTEQGSNRPRLKNRLARVSGRRPFATPSKLLRGINLLWKTASFRKNKEEA